MHYCKQVPNVARRTWSFSNSTESTNTCRRFLREWLSSLWRDKNTCNSSFWERCVPRAMVQHAFCKCPQSSSGRVRPISNSWIDVCFVSLVNLRTNERLSSCTCLSYCIPETRIQFDHFRIVSFKGSSVDCWKRWKSDFARGAGALHQRARNKFQNSPTSCWLPTVKGKDSRHTFQKSNLTRDPGSAETCAVFDNMHDAHDDALYVHNWFETCRAEWRVWRSHCKAEARKQVLPLCWNAARIPRVCTHDVFFFKKKKFSKYTRRHCGCLWSDTCALVCVVFALHYHTDVFDQQKNKSSGTSQVPSRCLTRNVGFFSISTWAHSYRRLLYQCLFPVNTHDTIWKSHWCSSRIHWVVLSCLT